MSQPNADATRSRAALECLRILACTWLGAIAAGLILTSDAAIVPSWLIRTLSLSPDGAQLAYRVQITLIIAVAGLALLHPRSWKSMLLIAFSWLVFTDIAAWTSGAKRSAVVALSWFPAWAAAAIHGAWLVIAQCKTGRPVARLRLSPAWPLIACLAILATAVGIGGRVDVTIVNPGRALTASRGGERLDIEAWVGQPFAETKIARAIPDLARLPDASSRVYILIHPNCARCLEVFDLYFSELERADCVVINLDAPGGSTDEPTVAELMPTAKEFTLPQDRLWIIETPAALIVKNGQVSCAATVNLDACLSDEAPGE